MKIYAVVSGCYSDFSINALFTKEEDAKKFILSLQGKKWGKDCSIYQVKYKMG